ncbi:unnamed protein product [Diplocarpon coronariae]|nr:2-dehydropantoate 2-reductase [Diplocarpon mali]
MQMFGFAFARMDVRPPVRFIVNSNLAVDQFYRSEGQIKLVHDDNVEIAEGFDVEQVDGINLKQWRAVDMARNRHLKLKTLVLETNYRFSKSVVSDPDHKNWTYNASHRNYRKPVKFLGDPSGVMDPTEPEMVIAESKLLDGRDLELKVMDNKAAESDEPIKHLIVDMEPSNLSACLMGIKHRLRWDSTILFIQRGMGIQEMLDQDVFPDPETRPNYMIGTFTINIAPGKSQEITEDKLSKDDPLGHLMERYINQNHGARYGPLVIHSASPASLCISPVLVVKGESPQQYAAREKASHYLIDLLLNAKLLNTEMDLAERHRDRRYRQTAIQSIVPSMAVMFNCLNGGILDPEPERQQILKQLLREASEIMAFDIRDFNFANFQNILAEQITNKAERVSPMMIRIASGKETSVEWTNGYMVKRGIELAKHGVPFPHQHLQMFDFITEKTRECSHYIQALQDERAKLLKSIRLEQEAEQKALQDEGAALPSAQELWLERQSRAQEKIDLKYDAGYRERMKMERRRMNPIPQKDFTTPTILSLGNYSSGNPVDSVSQEESGPMKMLRRSWESRNGKKHAEAKVAEPSGL